MRIAMWWEYMWAHWTPNNANKQAINIQSVLNAYKEYVLKMLQGRTENELWLERINQIPENNFRFIGSGGYGRVYKIKLDKESSCEFAVKIVEFGDWSSHQSELNALETEYEVVSGLENHRRIIQFFAYVPDINKSRIMIVMEYLSGGSLADKLKDHKPLSNSKAHRYLKQILEAVDFLHPQNIYHSDIKPANILLTARDDIKLCDFGIAVAALQSSSKSSSTSTRHIGTYHYMSPERMNSESRSAANDIWSVGATFVHMITGQPLNHTDETIMKFCVNISQYKISIAGKTLNKYLKSLKDADYKKQILSRTLCDAKSRANSHELLAIVTQNLPLIRVRVSHPEAARFSEPARGFLHMWNEPQLGARRAVPRGLRERSGASDSSARHRRRPARRVQSATRHMRIHSECMSHERLGHTTRVFAGKGAGREVRRLADCTEPQRRRVARGAAPADRKHLDTRVVRWVTREYSSAGLSTSMELFRVESGPIRIARLCRIDVPEEYMAFSATSGSDTLVAMSHWDWRIGAATARRPARGTRAHPTEGPTSTSCGSLIVCSSPSGTPTRNRTPSQSSKWAARDSNAAANSSPAASASMWGVGVQWTRGSQSLMTTQKTCCSTRWIRNSSSPGSNLLQPAQNEQLDSIQKSSFNYWFNYIHSNGDQSIDF